MERKEFLMIIWNKIFRPLIIIFTLYYCLSFVYNIFKYNGAERKLTFILLGIALLISLLYFAGKLFIFIVHRININLPPTVKKILNVIIQLLNYSMPLAIGALIYNLWISDWVYGAFFTTYLLIAELREIITNKTTYLN